MSDNIILMPSAPQSLVGRIVALNLQQCKRFQCGGFWLNTTRLFSTVDDKAQQEPIRAALLDGRLIDITDQNITGFQTANGQHTPARELDDPGVKVFLQRDDKGNLLVVAPKDEEETVRLEQEIQKQGFLNVPNKVDISDTPIGGGTVPQDAATQILDTMANHLEKAKAENPKSSLIRR